MTRSGKDTKQVRSVIFLHIPKTAGSTLNGIIDHQFKRTATFTRHPHFSQEFNDEFKKLSEAQRERIRLVKGHMFFGLHEFLPQPAAYITMLRDPVDRIISYYYHTVRHPNYEKVYNNVVSRHMSLKDFASCGLTDSFENGQTRLLSGVQEGDTAKEILERAKKNLQEHFAVVGLTERFDETLILLKRILGWRNIFYTKLNVGMNRSKKKEDIPKETLSIIEKYNELDIELYRYAQERFEEQIRQQDSSFEKELREFRSLNKLYGNLKGFLRPMTTGFRRWVKTMRAGNLGAALVIIGNFVDLDVFFNICCLLQDLDF
jgi:hypothetical protein